MTSVFAATLLAVPTLCAQIVADGATNTLSNVTTNIIGDVTVGTNVSFTLLILSDNALLTNSANGLIGRNTAAKSNEVQLLSASARWRMGGSLFVGSNGALNRLVVSNGAFLENNDGVLGSRIDSSNNVALVTGAGSIWSNRNDISVGILGRNNQVIVSNGGWVASRNSRLGGNTSASNNLVLVSGSNSVWSNAAGVFVGNAARGNLVIEAGGLVHGDSGTVGGFGSASSSEALVTGPGSRWNNASSLTIGNNVGRNRLVVSNGAAVWSGTGLIGGTSAASSNQVVVTGAGSVWSNQTFLYLGSTGNRVDVSDGGWLACNDGSFAGSSNTVVLNGSGSGWNNLGGLMVGEAGPGNVLIASNGATVSSSKATIGVNGGTGNTNLALITGAGTLWSNRNDLVVGNSGVGNRLQVDDAATVSSSNLFVGLNSLSAGNRVMVNGGTLRATNAAGTSVLDIRRGTNVLSAGLEETDRLLVTNTQGFFEFNGGTLITRGALINNGLRFNVGNPGGTPATWDVRAGVNDHVLTDRLYLGNNAAFNQLLVTNGALLASGREGYIGVGSTGQSNTAVISGMGSRLAVDTSLVDAFLTVGYSGSFNRLVVSNGGWVSSTFAEIGSSANRNQAVVSGSGSVWTNREYVIVGGGGTGNSLVVTNGGTVVSSDIFLGSSSTGSNNDVVVTGAGSILSNRGTLFVGDLNAGPGNQLLVSNGAAVLAGRDAVIGGNTSATSNSVIVVDPGTSLVVATNLIVGSNSPFNRLTIQNGGTLRVSGKAFIGLNSTSGSNVVLLTGAGSTWTNQEQLIVGIGGSGNRLVVSNGAVLENLIGYGSLGNASFDSNNEAIVTGAGSLWNLPVMDLTVGNLSHGHRLMISNGAMVRDHSGVIGASGFATNNAVVVTESGSVWTNLNLFVGLQGRGNSLLVSNGGSVYSTSAAVGSQFLASNNVAVVDGAGSTWTIANDLKVGGTGERNGLVITNSGALLSAGVFTMGEQSTSTNNRVVVDGGTLRVTNAAGTGVLDIRRGTNVLNAGLIEVDQLRLTNALGFFEFNGGTLSVRSSTVNNGQVFRVGNGVSLATFNLAGNGTHSFANGLTVSANGLLMGNGTVSGILSVQTSGTIAPGASIGKMVLSNSPSLQGAVVMEISKNGAALTNDQIQVTTSLTYGGALTVTNVGPTALAAGDNFKLFSAGTFAGSFTPLNLPSLNPGLGWTNKLLVDGSIEVVGAAQLKFASITVSGTNVIIAGTNGVAGANYAVLTATNITIPSSNWVSIVTNQFGSGGQFSFTNGIAPAEPQRYFRIRTP